MSGPRRSIRVLWKWSVGVTVAVGLFFAIRCGLAFYEGYMRADEKVLEFHMNFNGENYQQIYDHAAYPLGDQPAERDKWIKLLTAIHQRLGNARRSSLQHIDVTISASPFVTTRYQTSFDNGTAVEVFTWRKEHGMLKLSQYTVQSDALVLN